MRRTGKGIPEWLVEQGGAGMRLKDDHDHDGPDKAAVFGKVAKPLKAGEWHTAVNEIVGDTMLGSLVSDRPGTS